MIEVVWEDTQRGVTAPSGFRAGAARAGLKQTGNDIAVIVSDRPATVAGVFTTNRVHASSVAWSRRVVESGSARAVVANAGNANACNGSRGDEDTAQMAALAGSALGVPAEQVLVGSTGVIGRVLPMDLVEAGITKAAVELASSAEADAAVCGAVMTTDTRQKHIALRFRSSEWPGEVTIGGICKGSGMIAPNMATMLCFLTTDAVVAPDVLQEALASAVRVTFNRVTVDMDTSTNDMCVLLAGGASGVAVPDTLAGQSDLAEALSRVCRYLAREIARDGEGATKLVEVRVTGASSESDADQVARTIAESPLVKTALYGCDPNWGRIAAAAGRSGVAVDPEKMSISLGGMCVYRNGCGTSFDEQVAHDALKAGEVQVDVDLGHGDGVATVWTCDFSYDYVRINAEYHT